jgi:hypothetical protein
MLTHNQIITHNHTHWALEGKSCTVCSSIFEQVLYLSQRVVDLQNAAKLNKLFCSDCLTSSYALCDINHPKAVRSPGMGYMFCQLCWLKRSV